MWVLVAAQAKGAIKCLFPRLFLIGKAQNSRGEYIKAKGVRHDAVHPLMCLSVELEGIEPSSKRGSHTLSTCLFRPLVFVPRQDPDHPSRPYPLKLHPTHEAAPDYSRFYCTADLNASGRIAFRAMSRSLAWQGNKADLLYFD